MQGITRQRGRDSDGKRNARTESQNPGYARQRSLPEPTRQTHFLTNRGPIEERLDSRLSDLKAWVKQFVVQKGIQDEHKQ
jgi:hypothetical protein